MKVRSNGFFSKIFLLAALWNFSIGFIGIFFTDFSLSLFFGQSIAGTGFIAVLMFRLFMAAVIIFGLGYFIVSRDVMFNRGIIWLGLLSKLILFAVFIYLYFMGRTAFPAALAVTGDFLWSILFLLFLRQTVERVQINNLIG